MSALLRSPYLKLVSLIEWRFGPPSPYLRTNPKREEIISYNPGIQFVLNPVIARVRRLLGITNLHFPLYRNSMSRANANAPSISSDFGMVVTLSVSIKIS